MARGTQSSGKGKQKARQEEEPQDEEMDIEWSQTQKRTQTQKSKTQTGTQEDGDFLTYDPDMPEAEKRQVRVEYRQLMEVTAENAKDAKRINMADMEEVLNKANDAFTRVKGPSEAIIDSHLLLNIAAQVSQKAKSLKHDAGGFDDTDFVAQLVTFLGGRRAADYQQRGGGGDLSGNEEEEEHEQGQWLNWSRLTHKTMKSSRAAPAMDFMLGPLSVEPKKRQATQRAKLDKTQKVEQPEELAAADLKRSENETSENIKAVYKRLEQCQRINFFKFIINPHSFGQSVENMFYVSFMIRDAKIAFELDDSGEPMIFACDPPEQEQYDTGEIVKRQLVMELDVATWKRAIEVFNITESIIPTRDYSKNLQPVGKKGWY
ncbi:non-structural maintenance of chromosome element 4 [Ceratobasidium sp. AG-Ba]|nr:non-structural maintenance of chromosome element 4 [Ceratobasidium sp. AG-Ba]